MWKVVQSDRLCGDDLRFILEKLTNEAMTLIDLGCGEANPTMNLCVPRKTFVDIEQQSEERFNGKVFVRGDARNVLDFNLPYDHYDVAVATDFIEHLSYTHGNDLVSAMQAIASVCIIETPLHRLEVCRDNKGPHTHKSWWMPRDLGEGWSGVICPRPKDRPDIGWWTGWYGAGEDLTKEILAGFDDYDGPFCLGWDALWSLG